MPQFGSSLNITSIISELQDYHLLRPLVASGQWPMLAVICIWPYFSSIKPTLSLLINLRTHCHCVVTTTSYARFTCNLPFNLVSSPVTYIDIKKYNFVKNESMNQLLSVANQVVWDLVSYLNHQILLYHHYSLPHPSQPLPCSSPPCDPCLSSICPCCCISVGMSALMSDPDPYPQVYRLSKLKLRSM